MNKENEFDYTPGEFDEMYAYFDTPQGKFDSLVQQMMNEGWSTFIVGQQKYFSRGIDRVLWHEKHPNYSTLGTRYTNSAISGAKMIREIDHILLSVFDTKLSQSDEFWQSRIEQLESMRRIGS